MLGRSQAGAARGSLRHGRVGVRLNLQIETGLEVEPEPIGGSEETPEAQRVVGADPTLAMHDLVDPPRRNPDRRCKHVRGHTQRLEELLQEDLARRDGGDLLHWPNVTWLTSAAKKSATPAMTIHRDARDTEAVSFLRRDRVPRPAPPTA